MHLSAQDEDDAVSAIDKFFKNTWNAQRPMAKPSQQSMPHQPGASWQGIKSQPMHGYGSPVINIPPEHLQYWQQYQQQRMLQHFQQQQQQYQQQVQHAARQQHRAEQHPVAASAPSSSHAAAMLSQYNMQLQQQQPNQRQQPHMMPSSNGHLEPPARVASPFAHHVRTDSSESFFQPGTPDAAAQISNKAAVAAADDEEEEENRAEQPSHDRPRPSSQEEVTAPSSVPSIPPDSPQHPALDAADAALDDASSLPNASYTPHHSIPSSMLSNMPAAASAATRLPSGIAMPAADAITAGQATSPVPPAHQAAISSSLPTSAPASQLLQQQQPPSSMIPSMGSPLQGYGLPMPMQSGNNRDMYQYGGMMIPMLPPGMMLPPPPQQHQHHQSRAGRGGRSTGSVASSSGGLTCLQFNFVSCFSPASHAVSSHSMMHIFYSDSLQILDPVFM